MLLLLPTAALLLEAEIQEKMGECLPEKQMAKFPVVRTIGCLTESKGPSLLTLCSRILSFWVEKQIVQNKYPQLCLFPVRGLFCKGKASANFWE